MWFWVFLMKVIPEMWFWVFLKKVIPEMWFWVFLMKVIPEMWFWVFLMKVIPEMWFWVFLMKVIPEMWFWVFLKKVIPETLNLISMFYSIVYGFILLIFSFTCTYTKLFYTQICLGSVTELFTTTVSPFFQRFFSIKYRLRFMVMKLRSVVVE